LTSFLAGGAVDFLDLGFYWYIVHNDKVQYQQQLRRAITYALKRKPNYL
jgi:hypothetical protein